MTLQTFVDAREDLNIRAYEVWQGWAQQHALREIEERLRGEGVGVGLETDRLSPFAVIAFLAALAIGFVLLRFVISG